MKINEIIGSIFFALAGLAITLYGMKMMSDSLEASTGEKLSRYFSKISNNRFAGVGFGAGVTAVIQSSGATTIMVVGFVNAGVMSLFQAASIIMGANIGTTITAQIAAFSTFNANAYLGFISFIGLILTFFKKKKIKIIGLILMGLGFIFVGLDIMSTKLGALSKIEKFQTAIKNIKNPIGLMFIGLLLTAALQSSSALSAILISMAGAGLISINQAAYAIIGANIGSCSSAVMASFGASTNAKRATLIHIMFNIVGAAIFLPITIWTPLMPSLENMFPGHLSTAIAMFHTIFNISTTLLLTPFIKILCKFSTYIIKDKAKDLQRQKYELKFSFIDKRLISTPTFAIDNVRKEIINMYELAYKNLKISINAIENNTLEELEEFQQIEKKINFLNKELGKVFVQLNSADQLKNLKKMIGTLYHVINDIERIGDYAENIMESVEKMQKDNVNFSKIAIGNIMRLSDLLDELYTLTYQAFEKESIQQLPRIMAIEDEIDDSVVRYSDEHIVRLNKNECSPENGTMFISIMTMIERIADHMQNIGMTLKDYAKKENTKYKIKERN